MKKIKLTVTQRDSLLFKAFIKNVFPQPNKGEMFYLPLHLSGGDNDGKFIYLKNDYYEKLLNSIKEAELSGKFYNSNAEEEWLEIIERFNLAIKAENIDLNELTEWERYETPEWIKILRGE